MNYFVAAFAWWEVSGKQGVAVVLSRKNERAKTRKQEGGRWAGKRNITDCRLTILHKTSDVPIWVRLTVHPAQGNALGGVARENNIAGPTGQRFDERLARWAGTSPCWAPLPRALPWAGRTAGPSAPEVTAKNVCYAPHFLTPRCDAGAAGGVRSHDAADESARDHVSDEMIIHPQQVDGHGQDASPQAQRHLG